MSGTPTGRNETADVCLEPRYGNRCGMVAGATGTGKPVLPPVLAESFSRPGAPGAQAGVKGGLVRHALPASEPGDKITARLAKLRLAGQAWSPRGRTKRREHFGIEAQAEALAQAAGQDEDSGLATQACELAADDPQAALRLLAGRLQDRAAPPLLHGTYRELLRRQGMRDGLLVHGQVWIAALVAGSEAGRALRLVQECSELDPAFLPDDPGNACTLAGLAARQGMNRMAARLCRGFVKTWPRDARAPQCVLLGARLLGGPLGQPAQALVLLGRLGALPTDHPLRAAVDALVSQLRQTAGAA